MKKEIGFINLYMKIIEMIRPFLNTMFKLYGATATCTGGYVCYQNVDNMRKSYPQKLFKETKELVNNVVLTEIIGKSLFYGGLYPIFMIRHLENKTGPILYPHYNARIVIHDRGYVHTKPRHSETFSAVALDDNDDSQITIDYDDRTF